MTSELPNHVQALLRTGLDTFEESDRLLALTAANHYDLGHKTSHGLNVAGILLDQIGLSIQHSTVAVHRDTWNTETPRIARAKKEVAVAVGSMIGVDSVFYELVGSIRRLDVVVGTKHDSPDKQFITKAPWGLRPARPFFVEQTYHNDKARQNFNYFMRAVLGIGQGGVNLDDRSWEGTLTEIKEL